MPEESEQANQVAEDSATNAPKPADARPPPSLAAREQALCDSDPELYVHIRGPIDQFARSVWKGQSDAYERMQALAEAKGFASIEEAITAPKTAGAEGNSQDGAEAAHPGHAVIDEILSNIKVQHNPAWIKGKLDALRKLL